MYNSERRIFIFAYYSNNIQKMDIVFLSICFFPTPFLDDLEKLLNRSGMGLGIFYENLSIGIRSGFFSLFFHGFPAYARENHGKHRLPIINNSYNYRGDYGILRSFYGQQHKNRTWKFRDSQFSIDFSLKSLYKSVLVI